MILDYQHQIEKLYQQKLKHQLHLNQQLHQHYQLKLLDHQIEIKYQQ